MATAAKDGRDWFQRRHPAIAQEERALRKQRVDRERAYAKRDKTQDGGTAETRTKAARVSQGSLARLYMAGHLSADQLAASQEIRQVADRLTRDVHIGTTSVETRVDNGGRGSGAFFEKLGQVRAEVAYTRWRGELGSAAPAVLAMVVQDRPCRSVARASGMRDQSLRQLLSDALDLWPRVMGATCKEIDAADLLAMQAGLS